MPVTVIDQLTTATGRVNWLVRWLIKLLNPKIYPTATAGPSNALESKPWGFESSFNVSINRLRLQDLPSDWENKDAWPPLHVKRNGTKSTRLLLYYHGGGFVNAMGTPQWRFIAQLANDLEADYMIQTYIMVPHGGIHENIDQLSWLYQKIHQIAEQEGQELILCGDSAGATITASMLLHLSTHDPPLPLPSQAIMLAPAMVMDFERPENRALEPYDPILTIDKFSASTRAWSCGPTERAKLFKPAPRPPTAEEKAKMEHPLAAPLYGDWSAIADARTPITLSQGTYDILLPQVDEFVEKAKSLDLELTYIRAETACHVYPAMVVLPAASWIAPDSVEGMRLIVESVKRYSQQ